MKIFSRIVEKGYNTTVTQVPAATEEKEENIVINGPLSEVYTQALNQLYQKKDEVTNGSSMESQANDHHMVQQLVSAINQAPQDYTLEVPKTYVYATRLDLIKPDSLDDLQSNIDEFEQDVGAVKYVLVNDSTSQGILDVPIGQHIAIGRTVDAMESFVIGKGGIVVHSFADIFRK